MVLASRQEPSQAGGPSVANGFSHAAAAAAASMASILPRRILCHPSCKAAASPSSSSPSLIPLNSMEPLASQHEEDQSSCMHPESSPQLQSIPVRRIGAGLANLGNTCFLNSVLQCLTYTPPLAAHLQGGLHNSSCQVAGFCAMCALESHVKEALASHGRIVSPTYLVKNLRCISRSFQMWRQEDAHEYMRYLIEALQKCCSVELSGGKSLIQSVFGGRLRSQVKCTQCSHCSNTYDPFLDLSLEVMRADSLQKALARFTAVEVLDGDNKYQCSKCKTKVRALKQFTVDKAPPVLTVQFKRFSSSGAFGGKIDKKVHFDRTLDLKSFVNGGEDENLMYSLYAVLVHSGWSTHSGHYYCFVRTAMDKWHVMDDSQVSQVSERTVLEQKAYILFYVRDTKVTTLLNTDQCHGSNRDTSIAADLQVDGSLKRNGVSSETASAEAKENLSTEAVLETNGVSSITAFAEVYENLDTDEVLETNGVSSITAFAEVYENLDTDEVLKAWVSNGLSQSSWYSAVKIINSSCPDPDITVENQSVVLGCPRHVEDGTEKTQFSAHTKCAEDDTCRGDFSEHSENGQKSGCDSDELPVPESGSKESRCLLFDVAAPIVRNTFFEAAGQRALRILCMCAKFCFWSCFWSPL